MAPGPSRASRSKAAARIASRLRAARGSVAGDVIPLVYETKCLGDPGGRGRRRQPRIPRTGKERPVMAAKVCTPAPAGARETRGAARRWWVLAVASVAQLMVVLDK